ncbi:hypothetical protein [Micromonospora sp. DT231]|uniref:hypothetical protein n=1 Tax=Micromonospora sp. DT231 TaxID=3416526 RepID=UPI003CEAC95F
MSSDNQPDRGAIWNVRDLVGDLADEVPPAPAPRTSARQLPATGDSSSARPRDVGEDSAGRPVDIAAEVPAARAADPPWRGELLGAEVMPANPSGTSMRTLTVWAGIALVAVLVVAVAVAVGQDGDAQPGSSSVGAVPTEPRETFVDGEPGGPVPSEEPIPSATTILDPEDEALSALHELNGQDLPTVSLEGRYAAQLASKTVGIVDPNQVAENGSHTFYAQDILAEHNRLRQMFTGEARLVLLLSTDYGRQQILGGQPLWVTFALVPDSSKEGVATWCAAQFPALSAEGLENQCVPRRLNPLGASAG